MRTSSLLIGALFLLGAAIPPAGLAAQDNARGTAPAAAASAGDSDTAKRLQRIEEQIVDISAQLGTVESLARGAGAAAPGGQPTGDPGVGGDESRIGQLEMEIRALSTQMNDLIRRLQHLEGRSGIVAPQQQPPTVQRNEYADAANRRAGVRPAEQGTGFSVGGDGTSSSRGDAPSNGGFNANVEPEQPEQPAQQPAKRKSSGGLFGLFGSSEEETPPPPKAPSNLQPPQQRSDAGGGPSRVAAASTGQAKSLYDTAYADLMQRNYRVAADGFEQFVQRYPTDPLAGSAHFWLGEASFTNGEYRKAADNFLKCATNFPQNEKAPESLLKLGISLKRLNEKDAACSSFNELSRRFPNASAILQRAEAEKRRTGC